MDRLNKYLLNLRIYDRRNSSESNGEGKEVYLRLAGVDDSVVQ